MVPKSCKISKTNSKTKTDHAVLLLNKFIQDARYHKFVDEERNKNRLKPRQLKKKVVLLLETE